MSPPDENRVALAFQQAALVRSLVLDGELPAGFDPPRLQATATSLARKRARSVARAWPGLSDSLGPRFPEYFAEYASMSPMPATGGPLADGYAFSRWLSARGTLPEAGRLQALAVELRYRRTTAGLVPQRWTCLRIAWLGQSRRLILAVRLPWIGERWFHLTKGATHVH